MFSLLAGGYAERVVSLGQLAGARGSTRRGESRWPVVAGDPEPQCATPIDGLERPKLLGLAPEHCRRSLLADLHPAPGKARAGPRRISIDAGEGGIEALRRAPDALHRAVQALQALAGGGEVLIGTPALGRERRESLVFVERFRDLLHRGTQGLTCGRRRLPLGERHAKALLEALEREIARHPRGLDLEFPVRDHEPLALALEPEPVARQCRFELLPRPGPPQLDEVRAHALGEGRIPAALCLTKLAVREGR